MQESLIIVFFLIVVAAAGAAILTTQFQQARRLNDLYARLARRFAGTLTPGAFHRRPSVRFRHRGASVLVDSHAVRRKRPQIFTRVHFSWPDQHLRLEVYPERVHLHLAKLIGMQDLVIGSPQFDRNYIITGNDLAAIQRLLTGPVQAHINSLRRILNNDDIYVAIQGGRLLVKKRGLIHDYEPLRQLVAMAIDLYDQAILSQATGIEFVEQETDDDWDAVCQICGEPINDQVVHCRSCRTPHHSDCWQYYGACSTYGCGETRYVGGRRGKPP